MCLTARLQDQTEASGASDICAGKGAMAGSSHGERDQDSALSLLAGQPDFEDLSITALSARKDPAQNKVCSTSWNQHHVLRAHVCVGSTCWLSSTTDCSRFCCQPQIWVCPTTCCSRQAHMPCAAFEWMPLHQMPPVETSLSFANCYLQRSCLLARRTPL
jgi:hypothetical protein